MSAGSSDYNASYEGNTIRFRWEAWLKRDANWHHEQTFDAAAEASKWMNEAQKYWPLDRISLRTTEIT